jgi:hypothetical protein
MKLYHWATLQQDGLATLATIRVIAANSGELVMLSDLSIHHDAAQAIGHVDRDGTVVFLDGIDRTEASN